MLVDQLVGQCIVNFSRGCLSMDNVARLHLTPLDICRNWQEHALMQSISSGIGGGVILTAMRGGHINLTLAEGGKGGSLLVSAKGTASK